MMRLPTLTLVCCAALSAACNEPLNLTIVNFKVIDPASNCVVSASSPSIVRGVLDVGVVAGSPGLRGYVAAPLLQNNMTSSGTGVGGEHSTIQVTGVDVELLPDSSLSSVIPAASRKFFFASEGGRIPAGSRAMDPTFAEILPATLAPAMASVVAIGRAASPPVVTARVRAVGTVAGDTVRGEPADFPIEICNKCLLEIVGACPLPTTTPTSCNPGQDSAIPCCTQSGSVDCQGFDSTP